jgi:hypothetical protein
MDRIAFVPQSQKRINSLNNFNSKGKNNGVVYTLVVLFLIYSLSVGGVYWLFIVQEKNKVTEAIQALDSVNAQYYIGADLEQSLFNIKDLKDNSYDATVAIAEIESSYVAGAKISSFSYIKKGKIISIAMSVPSMNDVTTQIDKFNKLKSVSKSSYSAISSSDSKGGFLFTVEIILK